MTTNTKKLNKDNIFLAYYLASNEEYLTVVLPEKPTGRLKVNLKQPERRIDAECYDRYELHALYIEFDDAGGVVSWSHTRLKDACDSTYFLAYLADGRILGKNGVGYKLYNNLYLFPKDSDYSSHLDYLLSSNIDTVHNVKLWVKDRVIFGIETCEDYEYRDSWSIEDCLCNYLNTYDRYYAVKNTCEEI